MKPSRGFTLLEILLVLVLISVSAVAVIATFPLSQKDESRVLAQSLYQRIQLLNEEAILSGRDFGLRIDEEKRDFQFMTLTGEGWEIVDKPQFSAELKIESDLNIDFQLGGDVWGNNDDRLFEPGSLFDEDMFADEEKKPQPPQIFILSSGEMTPFTISFYPREESLEQSWRVVVKENGQIILLAPGDQDEEA